MAFWSAFSTGSHKPRFSAYHRQLFPMKDTACKAIGRRSLRSMIGISVCNGRTERVLVWIFHRIVSARAQH